MLEDYIVFRSVQGDRWLEMRMSSEITGPELVAEFKAFMAAVGYHPKTIEDSFSQEAEE